MVNLEILILDGNGFTGTIPSEIGNLTALKELGLANIWDNGGLTDPIPFEIGNMYDLEYLNLSNNQFSTIPSEIGNLSELKEIGINEIDVFDSEPVPRQSFLGIPVKNHAALVVNDYDRVLISTLGHPFQAELENVIYKHPTVAECAVIGIKDELLGQNVCVFVKKMQIPDFVFEFVRSILGTKINKSQSEIHYPNRFHFVLIFCKSLSFLTQIDQIVMKIIALNR